MRAKRSITEFATLVLAFGLVSGCTSPTADAGDPNQIDSALWHKVKHGHRPPVDFADGAVAPSDGGVASPDLAQPPAPADMAMAATPDLADNNPDNGGQLPPPPAPATVDPPYGPDGIFLTVSGNDFQNGDVVEVSGMNLQAVALATVSLTASTIVAVLPALNVQKPADLQVRVRRGGDVYPANGLPFQARAGHVYYLSPNGSDGAAGTLASPWKTVTSAAKKMAAGDVAYLRGGTYSGQVQIDASGTASAPITFTAYPSESPLLVEPSTSPGADLDTVRLTGAYVVLDRLRITDQNNPGQGIWIAYSAHDITIQNCEIFGGHGQGILISGNNNTIYRNHIHDNGAHTPYDHGIYVEGGGNHISYNSIHDNWTFGIQLYYGGGGNAAANTVEYNYIYHNGYGSTNESPSSPNAGIVIGSGHPNSVIRYNRFCGNAQYGIYLIDGQSGTQMTGNVTCYNKSGGVYLRYPGSGTAVNGTISYNDSAFNLSSVSGVSSNGETFYQSAAAPSLRWNGNAYTLAGFQQASGQDGKSVVADPKFANVPSNGFDPNAAASYDFCTQLNAELCKK